MAKKAPKEGVSKSESTRQYVARNPAAGPKEIVEGLRAEGIEISVALASKIKYERSEGAMAKKGRRKKTRAAAAAGNGSSERGQKAEAIRTAARSFGKKVRPKDVIAMLKEQGIVVSSAQVSQTLKAMGMRRTRRGRKARVGAVAAAPRVASRLGSIAIDDLIAAKKLVNQLGSVEAATQALAALAKLS